MVSTSISKCGAYVKGNRDASDLTATFGGCFRANGISHQEDFGTAGKGSPARPLRTRPATKSVKGTMSSPTLARSRALM
jgi:hypothetical protein